MPRSRSVHRAQRPLGAIVRRFGLHRVSNGRRPASAPSCLCLRPLSSVRWEPLAIACFSRHFSAERPPLLPSSRPAADGSLEPAGAEEPYPVRNRRPVSNGRMPWSHRRRRLPLALFPGLWGPQLPLFAVIREKEEWQVGRDAPNQDCRPRPPPPPARRGSGGDTTGSPPHRPGQRG